MNAYRFTSPNGTSFINDSEAFTYASEMTDGSDFTNVWKLKDGDWFIHTNNCWTYDPTAGNL